MLAGTSRDARRGYSRIKIISMGESNVGKSCLIKRYCEQKFVSRYISTIGVDFGVRAVTMEDGREVKVNFWDLSGDSDFLQIRNEFYDDAQAALLVFDVSDRKTFTALDRWMQEMAKHASVPDVVVVAGNKCDDEHNGKRQVSEQEGRKWAESRGFHYFDTSACSGLNVNAAFARMFNLAVKNLTQMQAAHGVS